MCLLNGGWAGLSGGWTWSPRAAHLRGVVFHVCLAMGPLKPVLKASWSCCSGGHGPGPARHSESPAAPGWITTPGGPQKPLVCRPTFCSPPQTRLSCHCAQEGVPNLRPVRCLSGPRRPQRSAPAQPALQRTEQRRKRAPHKTGLSSRRAAGRSRPGRPPSACRTRIRGTRSASWEMCP